MITAGDKTAKRLARDAIEHTEGPQEALRVPAEAAGGTVPLQIEGRRVTFPSDKGPVVMEPREPLVGEKSPEELMDFMPEYRRVAAAFEPKRGAVRLLESLDREIDVEVFFGTWCPHCEKLVPRIMRLDQEVENPKLRFHFRGLPGRIKDDPLARQYDVEGVPMFVVREGNQILGRYEGRALATPEETLTALLFGGSS
jgi:thiol-disulfide isomerase/thioredoxin